MLYDASGEFKVVTFEGEPEVDAVRESFIAHNALIRTRGNQPGAYREGIEKWEGAPREYRGSSLLALTDSLRHYTETTDKAVDALLEEGTVFCKKNAARRMKLGAVATELLDSLEIQKSMDANLAEILEDAA